LIAGIETEASERTPPGLRVNVYLQTYVVEIDGTPYPLAGQEKTKHRLAEFIQALIDAKGVA